MHMVFSQGELCMDAKFVEIQDQRCQVVHAYVYSQHRNPACPWTPSIWLQYPADPFYEKRSGRDWRSISKYRAQRLVHSVLLTAEHLTLISENFFAILHWSYSFQVPWFGLHSSGVSWKDSHLCLRFEHSHANVHPIVTKSMSIK